MITFDENGDVEVKLQGRRALVSSNALCLSSPVFAKMLRSSFKEGAQQNTASGERGVVILPEDDPEAFLLYCKGVHFRDVPLEPEPIVLAALAILCDKYDFSKAIVSWGSIWLQKWTKNTSTQDLSYLLILAYILGLAETFAEISGAIIMSHVGAFSPPSIQ
jgi:hypothetical protein